MADVPAAPAAPLVIPAPGAESAPPPAAAPLAGKYANSAELQKGIREGVRHLSGTDLLPEGELVGPGKFFADDAAAEAYYKGKVEPAIKQGKPKETPSPATAPLQIGGEPLPDNADVPTILAKAGLKDADVVKQFTEKGDLTEEQYKAIRGVRPGLTKGDIKFIAAGMQAQATLVAQAVGKARSDAAAAAGGAEQLSSLLNAAKSFVPEGEQAGINAMLQNPATTVAAVKVLRQMHADHIGAGGSVSPINGSPPGAPPAITSMAEYKALERRAMAGDAAARERYLTIDANKIVNP